MEITGELHTPVVFSPREKLTVKHEDKVASALKHHAIKRYVSGGKAPLITNLNTRLRSVISFTFPPLCPQGKSPYFH